MEMRSRQALLLAILLGIAIAAWFLTRPAVIQRSPNVPAGHGANEQRIEGTSTSRSTEHEPPGAQPAKESAPAQSEKTPPRIETSTPTPAPPAASTPSSATPNEPPRADANVPNAPPPQNAATERQLNEALENVRLMIRDYRTALGENPVGTNAEIMRAINGDNARQARIGPPAGQGLNANGELVDPWGTPFFFHQISGTEMEIRSAGPDRIMGTGDDREVK